jgi:PAS domain S-box-containing protein
MHVSPYVVTLFLAGTISAILSVCAWRIRSTPGTKPFAIMLLAIATWSLEYAFELHAVLLSHKILWARIQYVSIVVVPLAWLAFVLQYTGRREWLTRRRLRLLLIVPAITLVLVATDPMHGLIFKQVALDSRQSYAILVRTFGYGFWLHSSYSYLLLLFGTVLLLHSLIRTPRRYKGQLVSLLIATLTPWIGNAVYIFGLSPLPPLDPTPFLFFITGLSLSWGIFHYRLLGILPAAHKLVVNSMEDGVILLDTQQCIRELNPAAWALVSTGQTEVIGKPIASVWPQWPDLTDHCQTQQPWSQELELDCRAGQRFFDVRISPLNIRRHRAGCLMVLRDITESKRSAEALRKSEQRYRNLVENMKEIIFSADAEGRITYINPAVESVSGYRVSDLIGRRFSDFLHPDDLDEANQSYLKVIGGQRAERDFRFLAKSGKTVWFRISNHPVYDTEPSLGFQGIAINITETKHLQYQLVRSERLAATGQLAASVAHEINSPLQGIASILATMKRLYGDHAALAEQIDLLDGAFVSIRNTVKNLLDLNRPATEKKQPIDVNEVIEQTVALMGAHLKKRRIQLRLKLNRNVPTILASPQQLMQVFLNLINNSVEAIADSRLSRKSADNAAAHSDRITIETGCNEKVLLIEVTDTGPGIADEDLDRIFDPFYTRKKKMGIGVGLSICHGIIEDQKGSIIAGNALPVGAVFRIQLPLNYPKPDLSEKNYLRL